MMMMRYALAAAFVGALCAGGIQASTIPPNDPQIIINDPTCTDSCVPVTGLTFFFSAGPDGSNELQFQNLTGVLWFNIFVTTAATNNVTCASNVFAQCLVNTVGDFTTILFFGGSGIPFEDIFSVILTGDGEEPWRPNQEFQAVANIPEPATLTLFATGIGFVIAGRALRRRFGRRS